MASSDLKVNNGLESIQKEAVVDLLLSIELGNTKERRETPVRISHDPAIFYPGNAKIITVRV